MEDKHIKQIVPLLNIFNVTIAVEKVLSLADYLAEHWQSITSIPDYCTTAIIKALTPPEGIIGEDEAE